MTAELPRRLVPLELHDMVVVPILDVEREDEIQVNLQVEHRGRAPCRHVTVVHSRGQGPFRQF